MNLRDLLGTENKYRVSGSLEAEIDGIAYDSSKVAKGDLFAALPGAKFHGLQFLDEALRRGASAVLTDTQIQTPVPLIIVPNARKALALLSHRFYGEPSRKMQLIGVTGTNGKTTITFLLRSIYEAAGTLSGLIGTILYEGEQFSRRSAMTTPESPDLHRLLLQFLQEKCGACSMEVSSQGLHQHRVTACSFAAVLFTNLTRDHLDYHKTMERYFRAKLMLFNNKNCESKIAVVNGDDAYGLRIIRLRQENNFPVLRYGFDRDNDYQITSWVSSFRGTNLIVTRGKDEQKIRTSLLGKYNVYNVTAAYATADTLGLDRSAILSGIENMTHIPGRMEKLDEGQPFQIVIDYAHTEDAFRQLLSTLRQCTQGRIIHIFGCRGERDRGKRSPMGKASGELADVVVLTSDNPATEDPVQIMQEVRNGIDQSGNRNVHEMLDRGEAIELAVNLAQPGDTVVITGKGNETYQILGTQKLDFDEKKLFRKALAKTS